jgi:hypothetical protein
MGRSTIIQYKELVYYYHPNLKIGSENKEIKEIGKEVGLAAE